MAAGVLALTPRRCRRFGPGLAVGAMGASALLAILHFGRLLNAAGSGEPTRSVLNFTWFHLGAEPLRVGWVLDPLSGVMMLMVAVVSLLIFVYSLGYMAHDENLVRFFCFLSLFAAAMLGLVLANSLLLLFIAWELVGLASYLLIGFWFARPAAAAAAQKAFITTRLGDLGLFLGMIWWSSASGTLLFYDQGQGCLESASLTNLSAQMVFGGLGVSTGIGLVIFTGAMGKSGQVPLHVWLPDAMEGPTPVSALIHAATMVAAGVFLMARVYPLLAFPAGGGGGTSAVLSAMVWVGATTALFAALIAMAQSDLKRILAYSTVSQLGYMMLGLGVGGVAVGMFHLITHAVFKALLFLGAGSAIHGCHGEQDIRRLGGLGQAMPITFATYAIGMIALSGVPLVGSGFWSKDAILHAAHGWPTSPIPFYVGLLGAWVTAFYMSRQVCLTFLGPRRASGAQAGAGGVHESPRVMTVPLLVLAVGAVGIGFWGTPVWPWFQSFLGDRAPELDWSVLMRREFLGLATLSTLLVALGLGLGWLLYGRLGPRPAAEPDVLARLFPRGFAVLEQKFMVDELYERTAVRWPDALGRTCDWMERWMWEGMAGAVALVTTGCAWLSRLLDERVVNEGFDRGCRGMRRGGAGLAFLQSGKIQQYLILMCVGLVGLVLWWTWGGSR
jgi:NADH-quinone oxidoreductase subunit L